MKSGQSYASRPNYPKVNNFRYPLNMRMGGYRAGLDFRRRDKALAPPGIEPRTIQVIA
jgi:hypothetical protein